VEPGDEYEDEDELSPIEENPYADIKLEGASERWRDAVWSAQANNVL
jgi:hypothetical protein